jgi:3-deoxy-manno-octulosonate cytidylyltransferase (CMP-KDO synthetase)
MALYFSRAPIEGALVFDPPGAFLRHVGLYAFTRRGISEFAQSDRSPLEQRERLEQLRALYHGIKIRVVITPWRSRGVDTPADLAALERDGGPRP